MPSATAAAASDGALPGLGEPLPYCEQSGCIYLDYNATSPIFPEVGCWLAISALVTSSASPPGCSCCSHADFATPSLPCMASLLVLLPFRQAVQAAVHMHLHCPCRSRTKCGPSSPRSATPPPAMPLAGPAATLSTWHAPGWQPWWALSPTKFSSHPAAPRRTLGELHANLWMHSCSQPGWLMQRLSVTGAGSLAWVAGHTPLQLLVSCAHEIVQCARVPGPSGAQ